MVRKLLAVGMSLALGVAAARGGSPQRRPAAPPFGIDTDAGTTRAELDLFRRVNQERAKNHLPPLEWNDQLATSARRHDEGMVRAQELSHQLPGEPELRVRIAATRLRFTTAGENVAYGPDIGRIHQGLMESPPHRANILGQQFNAMGIAVLRSGRYLYAAQNFAYVLPTYAPEEVEQITLREFEKQRQQNGLPQAQYLADLRAELRAAACRQEFDIKQLSKRLPGIRSVVAFTASRPEELSPLMRKRAADPNMKNIGVGACFAPSDKYGTGSFWVLVAFR